VLEFDNGRVAAAPSSRRNVGTRAIEAHAAGGERMGAAIVSEDRERAFEIEHQGGRHRRSDGRSTTDLNPHAWPVGTLGVETHALHTSRPRRSVGQRHEQSCPGGNVMYSCERRSSSLLAADTFK
jgi:hypothetical protein